MDFLYNENCLTTMQKRILPESIDLIVTSPPYDDLRKYHNDSKWNFNLFKMIANNLFKILKNGGVLVWVVGDATINGSETGTSFKQALYFKKIGFSLHDTMIYEKDGIDPPHKIRYYGCFEYMFILSKGRPKTFNPIYVKNKWAGQNCRPRFRGKNGNVEIRKKQKIKKYGIKINIWKYSTGWPKSYKEKFLRNHPAIFPEKLAEDHILSWSNKNDLIYDPFMGSGTTAKMAALNDRNWIGSEISKEYCKIIERRLEPLYKKNNIAQRKAIESFLSTICQKQKGNY